MNPLLIRRRGMMQARQGGLPYDAEIEYLQSDGYQIIHTGININGRQTVLINAKVLLLSTQRAVVCGNYKTVGFSTSLEFGGISNNNSRKLRGYRQNSNQAVNIYLNETLSINSAYEIELNYDGSKLHTTNVTTSMSGQQSSINAPNNSLADFTLFLDNRTAGLADIRYPIGIYYCKITVEGTVVADFFPVRVGTVGYMYDRVSGQLFGNSGTGDFILGPDIQ